MPQIGPTPTYDDFKKCVKIQRNLDFEAIDVLWLEPLKDLSNWFHKQSESTQSYINWFTAAVGVFGVQALQAFLKSVLEKIAPKLAKEFGESFYVLVGAVIAGIALGTLFDVLIRCGLPQVTVPVVDPGA